MWLPSLCMAFLAIIYGSGSSLLKTVYSEPEAGSPSEYNLLGAPTPLSIGEDNLSKYWKHQSYSSRYGNDMISTSETENPSLKRLKRDKNFDESSHLDNHHHLTNSKENHKDENFYKRTFPKIKISHRKNSNVHKDHPHALEESAPYLDQTNIKHYSNNFEDLNVPESQPALKSDFKMLSKNSHHKNDLRKHSRKHFPLSNKKTENDQDNTFDNKHKKHHKFGHGHKKENDINDPLHNHKESHHHHLDATKKKHFLSNSSRHVRLVNSSKKHHSKSKHKARSTKKTSHRVKNPKHSIHRSSRTHDHVSRKLKKHYIHGTKPNQLRKRTFDSSSRKRAEHNKHLRQHKHHGKRSLKDNRKVAHHDLDSKTLSKFLKELTKKLFSKNMSKHSANKLLRKYFSKAGKKYHENYLSKKLYKKYTNLKLPDHANGFKDANGTKDQKILNGETTVKSIGSDHTTNADTSTTVTTH